MLVVYHDSVILIQDLGELGFAHVPVLVLQSVKLNLVFQLFRKFRCVVFEFRQFIHAELKFRF